MATSNVPFPIDNAAPKAALASNPFALRGRAVARDVFATNAPLEASTSRTEGADASYFAIVPSGPAVPAGELESNVPAIEVMVLWGEHDVLHVSHLSPIRPFIVGEGPTRARDGAAAPDFRMEAEFLGVPHMPVAVPEGNGVAVLVPAGATIVVHHGGERRSHRQLREEGALRASAAVFGAEQYTLRGDETARVAFKGFVFQVKAVSAGRPLGAHARPDARPFYYVGGVGAFAAALLLAAGYLAPPPSMLGGDQLDMNNRYVQAVLEARELPRPVPAVASATEPTGGDPSASPAGASGAPNQPHAPGRSATLGGQAQGSGDAVVRDRVPSANDNVVTNAVATIAALFGGGASSAYGASGALGTDTMNVLGQLVGGNVATGGMGGLALSGTGVGTGCRTTGPGAHCTGHGTFGDGTSAVHTISGRDIIGREPGISERDGYVPHVIPIVTDTDYGGLTAAQIRRVVQRNVSQVQHCYEQGLQRNPSLAGRVNVSFMITPTGAVGAASVADSSLGDAQVGTCIASSVRRWSFPQPEPAGPVSVRFPFNLSQSGQ